MVKMIQKVQGQEDSEENVVFILSQYNIEFEFKYETFQLFSYVCIKGNKYFD